MDQTLLLADYARVSDGKLDLMGAGWTVINPGRVTFGIGLLLKIPWDLANIKHRFTLDLLDADGALVLDKESNQALIQGEGEFEIGRPPGVKPGTTQHAPFALNVMGIPLEPGTQYQLRLVIDGDEDRATCCSFMTRSVAPTELAA